jgi:hypothetical protein
MKNSKTTSLTVNIVVKKEGSMWVGHCLELDIVSTSDSIESLKKDMKDLIVAQVEYAFSNDNLDHLFHPAPKEVWEEFYKCKAQTEDKIMVTSKSKPFVPPWIIAKTCLLREGALA